jgi:hypothetical protein
MPKFNDDENKKIDTKISGYIKDMTQKLKECEDNIKIISYTKLDSNQTSESIYKTNISTRQYETKFSE